MVRGRRGRVADGGRAAMLTLLRTRGCPLLRLRAVLRARTGASFLLLRRSHTLRHSSGRLARAPFAPPASRRCVQALPWSSPRGFRRAYRESTSSLPGFKTGRCRGGLSDRPSRDADRLEAVDQAQLGAVLEKGAQALQVFFVEGVVDIFFEVHAEFFFGEQHLSRGFGADLPELAHAVVARSQEVRDDFRSDDLAASRPHR